MEKQLPEMEKSNMETEVVEAEVIRISVRSLVEFIFRSGDIDNRIGKGVQKEAMQEGSRMHRRIQNRMGTEYRAEVSLKEMVDLGHYMLSVEGRADGIFLERDTDSGEPLVYIDEIKSMYTDVTRFEEMLYVHKAQALCYAYIYAKQNGLAEIGIQLTYCDLDTESIKRFREIQSFAALELWFTALMEAYRKWTDFQYEWNLIRRDSIKPLEFPFPYRVGQQKLVADVYRTIYRKKTLFLQAPTGTGKTISTVFPAVKAVGEGLAEKIFYLTAKTITRTVAKETFDLLKEKGLQQKVILLTAKEKLCPCEEMDCNPVHCPYAKGHYDRVNDAVFDLINHEHDFHRECLLDYAEKHQVCPFEMALDASMWSDVIICDYNYVFDPNVYLKRYFAEGLKGEYLFLIDEAHNLVERGREMYSATLVKEEFLKMKRILKDRSKKIVSALEKCNKQMLEWKRECEKYKVYEAIGPFAFSLMRLMSLLDEFLQNRSDFPERKEVTEFYLNLRHFMNMFELVDENYIIYTDFDAEGNFVLHLYCANPAVNLQQCIEKGRSAVFFSATLLPIQYYKKFLSTKADNYAVYAESTFSREQRLLFVARDVSSLYTRRNQSEFQRIASYIKATVQAKQGNYLIFFPSYRFMEDVYEQYLALNPGKVECLLQSANMNETEREAFVNAFTQKREQSLVGFCVLGGIFSEGIDLKEDRLIGVLIVGTGLPQICNEREVLKEYYGSSENGERAMGFAYSYQFPGMNKVLQAAGRVIRTAADVGIIGLLDDRFLRRDYRALFPREWEGYETCRLQELPQLLSEFWDKKETAYGSSERNASTEACVGMDGL